LVAAPGLLNLDDLGAHITQQHGAIGAGQGLGQIDDEDVV
jgi:hypothetical protein